jgi:hypothetical protein
MKKLNLILLLIPIATLSIAQQNNYLVNPGNGNGLRFWDSSDNYKIHMGTGAEYFYGPVNDYSIKMNMNAGSPGRGWTWGVAGSTPVAAISTTGEMQIGGNFGALRSGTYLDPWGKWTRIGDSYSSSYPLYLGNNRSGLTTVWDSDGAFFGLSDEGGNRKDAIIAWGDDADDNLRFLFNNGELARLTANGNLGINTVSPSTKIHIVDGLPTNVQGLNPLTKLTLDAATGGFAEFRTTQDNNSFSGLLFTDNNLGGYVAFRNAPDDKLHVGGYGGITFEVGSENSVGTKVERMRVDANGNVGIGTTTPGNSYKLDVNGTINAAGILINGVPFAGGGSQWTTSTSGPDINYSAGNVGIGTTTPNSILDIQGQVATYSIWYCRFGRLLI